MITDFNKKLVGVVHSGACLKLVAQKKLKLLKKIDFLEVRLDSLVDQELPKIWPLPVIATARHPREGGQGNLALKQRRSLLEEALSWSVALDVEFRSRKELASTIVQAEKMKRAVIFSFHDFQSVPSVARLEKMAFQAQEEGAALFKVAATIQSFEELKRLWIFQCTTECRIPIATMGMGEGGEVSRLILGASGSALNYGWLSRPQVSGQWSIEKLIDFFSFGLENFKS